MKNIKIILTAVSLLGFFSGVKDSHALLSWNQSTLFAGVSNSYISVPHHAALNITGSFTVEMWVSPLNVSSAQILLQKRGATASGYTLYLSSGRVAIRTGSSTRLVGKTVIAVNTWTHVAGTYELSTNTFSVYVNGVLDTSSVVTGAAPTANTDSLLIGAGSNNPFSGSMDEIRIWSECQSSSEVNTYRRLSLGTNSGIYKNLQASFTFQNNDEDPAYSTKDWSGNNLTGNPYNVTANNHSDAPSEYLSLNECVSFDGTGYLSGPNTSAASPTAGVTIDAWVYPESFDVDASKRSVIVHKGNASGTVTDYNLSIQKRSFQLIINEASIFSLSTSGEFFPLNQWTHISLSYSGTNGFIKFLLNGKIRWDDTNFVGNIHSNTDSLYIGGTNLMNKFNGLLDEVRITGSSLPASESSNTVFASLNEAAAPGRTDVVYNFDGGLFANTDNSPRLNFRGGTSFSNNSIVNNSAVSPITLSYFSDQVDGYYMSSNNVRIPETGTSGFMKSDTLKIPFGETISDISVFLALNHTDEDNLVVSLISPAGTASTLYSTASLVSPSDNLVTEFDDDASTALQSNKFIQFAPKIRPLNNLNTAFTGQNTSGKWILRIQDVAANDTGRLFGWGIKFNNQTNRIKILSMRSLIQGFYDSTTNLTIKDTVRVQLRYKFPPYNLLDSSKAVMDSTGSSILKFQNADDLHPFFIIVKHRNSIETWSRSFSTLFELLNSITFSEQTSFLEYDFRTTLTRAFGNNLIKVDNFPSQFAIFGGDVNQDGSVNLADITGIFNNAATFTTGYQLTDVTGDNATNLTDIILAFNNAAAFVTKKTP